MRVPAATWRPMITQKIALARRLVEADRFHLLGRAARAFRARCLIAASPTTPLNRSYLAPNYSSDLGLRRSDDPRQVFRGALDRLGGADPDQNGECDEALICASWLRDECTEQDLVAHLDALISFAGEWDQAARLAAEIVDSGRDIHTPKLLTICATALAATGSPVSEQLFLRASTEDTAVPEVQVMSLIRLAAFQLKRRGDPVAAGHTFDRVRVLLETLHREYLITAVDRMAFTGVLKNLQALASIKAQDVSGAFIIVREGLRELTSATEDEEYQLHSIGVDEVRRYRCQLTVNLIQLLSRARLKQEGMDLIAEHSDWSYRNHYASYSEALSAGAYAAYNFSELRHSSELAFRAIPVICSEAAPSRLLIARKICAASLYRSSRNALAQHVLSVSVTDPLGFESESPHNGC